MGFEIRIYCNWPVIPTITELSKQTRGFLHRGHTGHSPGQRLMIIQCSYLSDTYLNRDQNKPVLGKCGLLKIKQLGLLLSSQGKGHDE